jgi:hypothetical protein
MLVAALAAVPCTVVSAPKLWAKPLGSRSKLFPFERDGKVGFIDNTGRIVIPPAIEARIDGVGDFAEGLARIESQGYIDETGAWVIRNKAVSLGDFSDGLASFVPGFGGDDLRDGYLDRIGREIFAVGWGRGGSFSEGLSPFEGDGQSGEIASLRGAPYRDPEPVGFIDKTGMIVIAPLFAEVGPFVQGLARAALDGPCYRVTPENDHHGSPATGNATSCGGAPPAAKGPCAVGFISRNGVFAIPAQFEAARDFSEDFAAVRSQGRWGYIGRDGSFVIPPQFEQAESFHGGFAAVKIGKSWGYIDRRGTRKIPARYSTAGPFSEGLALVSERDRFFYINARGGVAIRGPFAQATDFVQGLAAVRTSPGRVRYINPRGKEVFAYDWKP